MLLLDTSFLIELEGELAERRSGAAQRLLAARRLEPVAVSVVAFGEFAEGFEDRRAVDAFLAPFTIVPLSRAIAYRCALMQQRLPRRLGENDAWIAATALSYGAELAGREHAFGRVPRLRYTPI